MRRDESSATVLSDNSFSVPIIFPPPPSSKCVCLLCGCRGGALCQWWHGCSATCFQRHLFPLRPLSPALLQRAAAVMAPGVLLQTFRSFLDRLYVLQRFKLFVASRSLPSSPPIQSQNLRRQIVALVEKHRHCDDAAASHAALWNLDVRSSLIPNAGNGIFLRGSSVPAHTLLTLYPGDYCTPQ